MTDKEILKGIKEYFAIEELVDEKTYKTHKERAWKFFDIRLLETMLIIRRAIDKSITVNNWHRGLTLDERGLRTNVQDYVRSKTDRNILYLSAHVMGKALDFNVSGMTGYEVREWIVEHQAILPYKVRLEDTLGGKQISWVHLDMYAEDKNPKVYLMKI